MTSAEHAGRGARARDAATPRRLPDWAGDAIAIAVVVLGAGLPGVAIPGFGLPGDPLQGPAFPGPDRPQLLAPVVALGIAVVAAALLPLRRRLPLTALVGTLVCLTAAVALGVPSLGPGAAAAIAAFGLANRTARRTALVTGGGAALFVALLSVAATQWSSMDARVFQVAAAIAVATALGDSTRSRREYVAAVTERAERAERTREAEALRRVAEERLRIAQDLHDTVAHRIAVISLNAGVASSSLEDPPAKARDALAAIRGASRDVLSEIGELLRYLRADEPGAEAAPPQPGLDELDELVRRMSAAGLEVDVRVAGDTSLVAGATDLAAYRVIQEGLTNAHKHGSGGSARLWVTVAPEQLAITVENPVAPGGRDPDAPRSGLGLIGIHERVSQLGGTALAKPVGGGYRLAVALPLDAEAPR